MTALDTLAEQAQTARLPVPLCARRLGVKCGGSDPFGGLTANSLIGRVVDRVSGANSTVPMTEIPETSGAERL
jgi:altronate hydrolase